MTPAEAARLFKGLQAGFAAPILAGLRKGVRAARKTAQDRIRATSLGRALMQKKTKKGKVAIEVSVTVGRARMIGPEAFECSLQAGGAAGLIEAGGRTKPHKINAAPGKRLVFEGSRGLVNVKVVSHPGSRVAAVHALQPALAGADLAGPIDRELQSYVQRESGLA